jgi:hypothetical protein
MIVGMLLAAALAVASSHVCAAQSPTLSTTVFVAK